MKCLSKWTALGLIVAAVCFAQDVKTDYSHKADFSKYQTYSWANVQTENPLWVDRIKSAVNRELEAKGWMMVPSGGEASLVAIGTTKEKQNLETFYDTMPGWYWDGFGDSETTTQTYKVGTLVVDIFDSHTKKLLWRGSSSDTLSGKPEQNVKKLDKGVKKMFDHFPPGAPQPKS
jgi:hypothetical protein